MGLENFYGTLWDVMRPYFPPGITQEQADKSAELMNAVFPKLKLKALVREGEVGLQAHLIQTNLDTLLDTIVEANKKGPLIDTRHLDA